MTDELETALTDLVDAARKIGEWKAEPAPLTLSERGAWNLRIAELTAAEANARQTIRRLFAKCLAFHTLSRNDLGAAIPQSAILEAGRPKPLKVEL